MAYMTNVQAWTKLGKIVSSEIIEDEQNTRIRIELDDGKTLTAESEFPVVVRTYSLINKNDLIGLYLWLVRHSENGYRLTIELKENAHDANTRAVLTVEDYHEDNKIDVRLSDDNLL